MVRIGFLSFPVELAEKLGDAYAELHEPPDYITITGVYLNTDTEDGMHVMAFYEFDDDRADEARDYLDQRYADFCNAPGAEYRFEDWINTQNLLALVHDGMPVKDVLESISISI